MNKLRSWQAAFLAAFLLPAAAFGQAVLQSGPHTDGDVPVYVGRDGWIDYETDAAVPLCRSVVEDATRLTPGAAYINAADSAALDAG